MSIPTAKCRICRHYDGEKFGCSLPAYQHMTDMRTYCPGLDVDMSFLADTLQDMQDEIDSLKQGRVQYKPSPGWEVNPRRSAAVESGLDRQPQAGPEARDGADT